MGAGVWFTSAGLPVYGIGPWRKPPDCQSVAWSSPQENCAYESEFEAHGEGLFPKDFFGKLYAYFDDIQGLVPVMAKSFGVGEERIRVWGQPRNDGIFVAHDREAILRGLYRDLPEYKNIVLYAPTFRDGGETRLFPFADYDRDTLGIFWKKKSF